GFTHAKLLDYGPANIGFSVHDCLNRHEICLLAVPNFRGKIRVLTNPQPSVLLLSTTDALLCALDLQRSGRTGCFPAYLYGRCAYLQSRVLSHARASGAWPEIPAFR